MIVRTGLMLLPAKKRAIKNNKIRINGKVIKRMFFKIKTISKSSSDIATTK